MTEPTSTPDNAPATPPTADALATPPPAPAVDPAAAARRENWLWAGLLVILTLIVYQPAIHGEFLWDDNRYVMMGVNTPLRSADGLAKIWLDPSTGTTRDTFTTVQYYPLTYTLFWIQYHLWGLSTTGYHVVNVLLHAGSALLLWRILLLLRLPGAWLAAAVFAVHPIQVESVAWITELKNVLSGFLFLAALYAYLRFAQASIPVSDRHSAGGEEPQPSGPSLHPWLWYAIAFVLFAAACFAKSVAATMAPVAALLIYWRFRPAFNVRTLAGLVPFLVLGALLGRQTAWMEQHIVGATGPDWDIPFGQRLLVAGHAFWFYIDKIVWPTNLSFTYPRWNPADGSQWVHVIAAVVTVAAAVVMVVTRRFTGVGVAILAYTAMLFPAMGFVNVYPMRYSFVADHFQYLAGMAIIALVVTALTARLWRGRDAAPPTDSAESFHPLQAVAGVLVLVLAVLAWRQSSVYANPVALWTDTVKKNPDAWMAHRNLGAELINLGLAQRAAGDPEAAAKSLADAAHHLERTVALRPTHDNAFGDWARALMAAGKLPDAVDKINKAIALDPNQAGHYVTLGEIHMRANEQEPARAAFIKAISLDAGSFAAHMNLGHIGNVRNDLPAAEASFKKAEQLRPNDPDVHYALAVLYDRQKRFPEALAHARRAAELAPDSPDILATLGYIWGANGRPAEAYQAFQAALNIQGDHPRALEGAKLLIDSVAKMRRAATQAATTRATTTRAAGTATRPAATGPATTTPAAR